MSRKKKVEDKTPLHELLRKIAHNTEWRSDGMISPAALRHRAMLRMAAERIHEEKPTISVLDAIEMSLALDAGDSDGSGDDLDADVQGRIYMVAVEIVAEGQIGAADIRVGGMPN